MRAQEIQKHVPSPNESCLVNAGEKASQVLVDENKISINRGFSQDGQESIYISRSKVVWAGHWDKLEDHSRKDVWHRPKRGIHKGYDGTAALECFRLLDQDVSRWRLATFAGGPRIGLTILLGQLRDECVDNRGGFLIDRFKNGRVHEGSFDRLIVEAGTVNSE